MAVYNAEKYLSSAVRNILTQTYSDYELLLIDDGSSDSSRRIAERLAGEDSRIRLIFKEKNDGLAVVRNISIQEAKGEYLLMVDADDLMDDDTLEKGVLLADSTNADVILWDYDIFYNNESLPEPAESHLNQIDVSNRESLLNLPAFMPVRLIRLDYARNRNLSFPQGLTKQDIPVHWRMMTDENCKIALLSEKLFHYRQHTAATSARKGRSLFSLAKVMDIVGHQLKDDNIYDKYRNLYLTKRLSLLHGMYDFIQPEYKDEALQMIKDRLDSDAIAFFKSHGNLLSRRTRLFYRKLEGDLFATLAYSSIILARKIYRKYAK